MSILGTAGAIALSILASACSKPKDVEYKGIKDFQVLDFDGDSATLSCQIGYFNPNNFELKVKDIDCNILANDIAIGHYVQDSVTTIAANALHYQPLQLKIGVRPIISNGLQFLTNKSINFKFKGISKVGRGKFFIKMPINFSKSQKLNLF